MLHILLLVIVGCLALCAVAHVAGFVFGLFWHLGAWALDAFLQRSRRDQAS